MKKIIALVLALAMVALCIGAAVADTSTPHTITIKNTDQNVVHTYKAYQVFKGTLDATEQKLSNIEWGDGVNKDDLLSALKNTTDAALMSGGVSLFKDCTDADSVARVLGTFASTKDATGSAGAIDAAATIIAANLNESKAIDFSGTGPYTANVVGDGYYFVKDATTTLNSEGSSDTVSKHLLSVIRNEEIVAKDTGITPDKKILDAVNGSATSTKVAADSSAIGDTVNFSVTVNVPNTAKYEDHFWFVMKDKLDAGLTFTGIKSVKIGNKTLADATKESAVFDSYDGTDGYYTLKVAPDEDEDNLSVPSVSGGKYAFEAASYNAVAAAGGQAIELTFNEFKKFVEKNNLIGQNVTIEYTAVLNDDAEYKTTANENEVYFQYSNNPNHDYDGDNPGPHDDSVTGKTPHKTTRTYTTSLKILKVDENHNPLAGATFELKGNSLNRTVVTGFRYEKNGYTAKGDETVDNATSYWELNDGSFTATDPATVQNKTQYKDTDQIWRRVDFSFDEVSEQTTDLVVVTNASGIAEFVGLREGADYTLEEIAAPQGFNKIDGKSTFKIEWSDPDASGATSPAKDQGGFTLTETGDKKFSIAWNDTDKQFEAEIENHAGTTLPSTGGIGTTIFYILGGLLVVGAAVILVARRKASN